MRVTALTVLFICLGIANLAVVCAQISVVGDTTTVVNKLPFKLHPQIKAGKGNSVVYTWDLPKDWRYSEKEGVVTVQSAPDGKYTVRLRTIMIIWDEKKVVQNYQSLTLIIGKGADPKPKPPEPDPAPIPVKGLRVLIIYDPGAEDKMPIEQKAIIFGQPMRDYLNTRCVLGPDNKTREWRIYPTDVKIETAPKIWRDAFARQRSSVPWLIVSNGVTGFEGELPSDVASTKKVIGKHIR